METGVACYREYAPSPALRDHVRAFFTFVPTSAARPAGRELTREVTFSAPMPFTGPMMAEASGSLVFSFGVACHAGVWGPGHAPRASAVGATSRVVRQPDRVGERATVPRGYPAMLGVYFRPGRAAGVFGLPASELTDRLLPLDDVGLGSGSDLAEQLDLVDEGGRLERIESVLVQWLARGPRQRGGTSVKVPELAAWIAGLNGQPSVTDQARAAGVSRQRLARVFSDSVGVSPKLYARLARFRAALSFVREPISWSRLAGALGYADQSHMIAEFREFCGLTPEQLVSGRVFHPFIDDSTRGTVGGVPGSNHTERHERRRRDMSERRSSGVWSAARPPRGRP